MLRDSYHIGKFHDKNYEEVMICINCIEQQLNSSMAFIVEVKVFEPSKFIYSFFAFNSFYSINWRGSQIQEELINWESQDMSELKED